MTCFSYSCLDSHLNEIITLLLLENDIRLIIVRNEVFQEKRIKQIVLALPPSVLPIGLRRQERKQVWNRMLHTFSPEEMLSTQRRESDVIRRLLF